MHVYTGEGGGGGGGRGYTWTTVDVRQVTFLSHEESFDFKRGGGGGVVGDQHFFLNTQETVFLI